jgi:ABC-type amino acid transport system permease subunit
MAFAVALGYIVAVNRLLQTGLFQPRKVVRMNSGVGWIIAWLIGNVPLMCTLAGLSFAQGLQVSCLPLSSNFSLC